MTMKCAHLWCAPCCENLGGYRSWQWSVHIYGVPHVAKTWEATGHDNEVCTFMVCPTLRKLGGYRSWQWSVHIYGVPHVVKTWEATGHDNEVCTFMVCPMLWKLGRLQVMTMKCAHLWCAPYCENLDTSVLNPLFFGMKESKHDIHHSVPLSAKSKNIQSFSYIPLSESCSNVEFSLTHLHLDGENVLMLTSQLSKYNCPQDWCYRTVAPVTYVLQLSTQKHCGQCYN